MFKGPWWTNYISRYWRRIRSLVASWLRAAKGRCYFSAQGCLVPTRIQNCWGHMVESFDNICWQSRIILHFISIGWMTAILRSFFFLLTVWWVAVAVASYRNVALKGSENTHGRFYCLHVHSAKCVRNFSMYLCNVTTLSVSRMAKYVPKMYFYDS